MDTFDRTWQGTEPLLFIIWNLTQFSAKKIRVCQLVVFALANNNLCGRVRIEIPYPALFPLQIPHPNPIKTRNPALARNCNSCFPPLFSAKIPNIMVKKSQIPHHAKPIGDPHQPLTTRKLWLQLNKSWFIQVTVIIKTILKSKNCPNTYFLVQIILLCLNYLSHKVKTTMHVFASKSENETLKCCFINRCLFNTIYLTLDFTNFFPVNPNFCFASEWKP